MAVKRIALLFLMAALGLILSAPAARAQFTNLPNPSAWNQFLSKHPTTAKELEANPSLIYNQNWLAKHPHVGDFLRNHPEDAQSIMGHGREMGGPGQFRNGAYDQNHQWHDQDWWYKNQPQWSREHHPEWWAQHKDWQGQPPAHSGPPPQQYPGGPPQYHN